MSPIHFNFYPRNLKGLLVFPQHVGGSFLASHLGRRTMHQSVCVCRPWRSQSQGLGTDQGIRQQVLNLGRRRVHFLDSDQSVLFRCHRYCPRTLTGCRMRGTQTKLSSTLKDRGRRGRILMALPDRCLTWAPRPSGWGACPSSCC